MNWDFENDLWQKKYEFICGLDEVGRGPLAGPVTVAAVILPKTFNIEGLKDSKALNDKQKIIWNKKILDEALTYSIISKTNYEIDDSDILKVTKKAMKDAVNKLKIKPNFILLDAVNIDLVDIPQLSLIGGDTRSPSIAAASIIAKVHRDNFMQEMDKKYPDYNFASNVGYGTAKHIDALKRLGPCEIHRRSFIKNFV